ncbi:unnamed protein product [Peniophora sp. CBMAI 1063]|nr:unnamed protein product [Peniophora sp. CBMAI 1063]
MAAQPNAIVVNGVVWRPYIPSFLLTRARFLVWVASRLFPAADILGTGGVATLSSFRQQLALFDLPDVWRFAEDTCLTDHWPDKYHTFYNAHLIGITAWPEHQSQAYDGFADARRTSVRSMQCAHVNLWRWLQSLAQVHLEHPAFTAEQVIEAALPLAPTRATRYDVPPIFPELHH